MALKIYTRVQYFNIFINIKFDPHQGIKNYSIIRPPTVKNINNISMFVKEFYLI